MRNTAFLLAASAVLAGCGGTSGTTRASPQPPASNTSFFAIVASGRTHKLYVPAQPSPTDTHGRLAVVDAAAPHASSGLIGYVDLGEGATPQAVGGSGLEIVVVDAATPTISFVDAGTDLVRGAVTLPAGAEPILASDNASFSMGAAVDATRRKAWVSASLGLLEYDLDSLALTGTFTMPGPENFAYDPVAGRLYSPFYACDPATSTAGSCVPYVHPDGPPDRPARMTDSLNIIDLGAVPRQVDTLADPAAADVQAPLGFEPDAVAIDFSLGEAVVAFTASRWIQVLDLDRTTCDATARTCAIPTLVAAVTLPGGDYAAVAADAVTHLAVAAQEYGAGIVFLDLARARQGIVTRLETTMPVLPGGQAWRSRGDPHGAGIGIVNGRPCAFLASPDRDWIARIDLRGVASVMAGAGSFAAQVAYVSVPAPP
jgi:hypothetical protein